VTLEIQDLTFAYDDDPVLDEVDLTVASGELLGLLGPNGSGKSTLLRCGTRLLEPDSGQVVIDSDRVCDLEPDERARRIGYVPQSESGAFPASAFETVLQGRRPHGGWSPGASDREAVERVLNRLDLADLATRNVDALSGGQRQKVRLGRALVGDPSALLLDEPTSSLDLKHRLEVMDRIVEHVHGDGVAGLIAIHDLNLAARYCDRVALLADRQVHTVGPPSMLTGEAIRDVYGVEASICEYRGQRLVVPEAPIDDSESASNRTARRGSPEAVATDN